MSLRPTALEPLETRQLLSAALATSEPLVASNAAIIASAAAGGDAYEANDTRETAFALTTPGGALSDVDGLATFTDNDWYRVRAGVGEFTAQLRSTLSADDLNIELYDANGTKLDGNYHPRRQQHRLRHAHHRARSVCLHLRQHHQRQPLPAALERHRATPTVPTTPITPPTPTPEPPTT